ncbi:MAG TPA: AAA family ATPase [Thermoanaerobaculia bacterium]|nr:AAA family ATPase [Thermoanaerobaculia bacterium]
MATLSPKEQARLVELRSQQHDLFAADPRQRARELTLRGERIDLLTRHVTDLFVIFRGVALDHLRSTAESLRVAQAALADLRRTTLTSDLLPGTGEETWRKMWEAAEAFSAIAYPKSQFPALPRGARCPVCQQEIGNEAEDRLRHLAEYVSSIAQERVRDTERRYEAALSSVAQAVIMRPDLELALNELRSENPALAEEVHQFLQAAERLQKGITEALALGVGFLANGMTQSPEASLQAVASRLRERAEQLQATKPMMTPGDSADIKELEARVSLSQHLQPILDEIERLKRIAAYDQCLADASTQAITRKSTELTKLLVTDQLRAGFHEELERLEFKHLAVEIQAAGGAKGSLFHKLAFTNAPGVAVTHVLSEGESRTLSLASFLTELGTAPNRSAIIFDDPVSSLDEAWRERIARRLVSEATERQVIVFTHDLLFLRFLLDESRRQEVSYVHQYIRRENEVGLCSPDLPWSAMGTNERIGKLRSRWQSADKLFRTARSSYEADARDIFGLLREAWERATTEVLLNDVVERYRHSIETQKVRPLHDITEDDCRALDAGMAECSRWMRGHDRPPADGTPFPEPEALKKRIDDLETWVKCIRKRRQTK